MSEFFSGMESDAEVASILTASLSKSKQSDQVRATTADEFIGIVRNMPAHEQLVHCVPHVRRLHKVVHHILPKPNRGLWEEQLGLDPFILGYLVMADENRQQMQPQGQLSNSLTTDIKGAKQE
jgi:hypothetical protein